MKKLSGFILGLLISGNVFCQTHIFTREPIIKNMNVREGILAMQSDFSYYFQANGKWYIVSYDPDEPFEDAFLSSEKTEVHRHLYLFRMDAPYHWVKASNVIQTDYKKTEYLSNGGFFTGTQHDYMLIRAFGYGNVFVLKNGCVVMFLTNEYDNDEADDEGYYKYNSIVIFTPAANETYQATRFFPENRKTETPELPAEDARVLVNGNKIKIEIYKKWECPDTRDCDGFIERNGEKIYYNFKYITTLDFTIEDNGVRYEGLFKLRKEE